ncbi:response regulator [Almyronema epifaneia]|uniref:Response regulator n=1 Tax=Almyronema epifaneia S1 TaxID=2991925 RepID=A0ABW6IIA3_9CYAN
MDSLTPKRLILVVENNPDHQRLIAAAFQDSPVQHEIVAIADGEQALDFLYRRGRFATATRPDLILLDLDLPSKAGPDLLAEIKAQPQLKRIPIVILTLRDRPEEVLRAYTLQGNCYVLKSADFDQLFQIIKRIEEFWLGVVTLPLE